MDWFLRLSCSNQYCWHEVVIAFAKNEADEIKVEVLKSPGSHQPEWKWQNGRDLTMGPPNAKMHNNSLYSSKKKINAQWATCGLSILIFYFFLPLGAPLPKSPIELSLCLIDFPSSWFCHYKTQELHATRWCELGSEMAKEFRKSSIHPTTHMCKQLTAS